MAQKKSIDYCRQLAEAKGGRCLSGEYGGMRVKYLWECKEGHRWRAKANSIQQGQWCPHCAQRVPHDLQWLQELAAERGGRCLSAEYKGMKSKYLWECSRGHQWEGQATNIHQGRWCPHCRRRSLLWLQELAAKRDGKCLSIEYKSNKARYTWECSKGHQWEAKAHHIKEGHWCPHCICHDLLWLQELAAQMGGKCLSTEYKNNRAKYLWECKEGHRWGAWANTVQQGHWCPRCARLISKPEIQLLEFVQQFYPDAQKGRGLLKNKKFELDIYVPSLKKAIEYDGERWHYSEWAIQKGVPQRDALKNEQCSDAGIQLLRIRERDCLENPEAVKQQILEFLKSEGAPGNPGTPKTNI